MSQIGGNIEQLTALKSAFDRYAATVSDLVSSVDSQLGGTYWEGPAAERFKSAWAGDFKRNLHNLQAALSEAGVEVARRRDALLQSGS